MTNDTGEAPQSEDALAMRVENTREHVARDIREGRFPNRSMPQLVPADLPRDERMSGIEMRLRRHAQFTTGSARDVMLEAAEIINMLEARK